MEHKTEKIQKMVKNCEKSKKNSKKVEKEEVRVEIREEILDRKGGLWNLAKNITLIATIIFLLFAISSTTLLLANKTLRERISNMVWGRVINLQEIDVFGKEKKLKNFHPEFTNPDHEFREPNPSSNKKKKDKAPITVINELKILRTVAESDHKKNHEAIIFNPQMTEIPLGSFRKQDKIMIPERFKNDKICENDSTNHICGLQDYQNIRMPSTEKCSEAELVVTIKSTADHFEHRQAIRDSWATRAGSRAVVVFLVGQPTVSGASSSTLDQIKTESSNFSDILLGDYIDSYANLTVKALSGLKWRNEKCPEPQFSLSIDDDTFVDLDQLLQVHLNKLPTEEKFIECSERTVVHGKVWREGRWAVSEDIYDQEIYPNYCNGPCYLMPKESSKLIWEKAQQAPTDLQADDAFITGVMRSNAEIPLIQYARTKSPGWCMELNNRKPRLPKRMIKEFEKVMTSSSEQKEIMTSSLDTKTNTD